MSEKKDFSNTKKLGFLRFIQVVFTLNVIFALGLVVFATKGTYTFDYRDFLALAHLAGNGIALWLIWQRKKAARPFIIAFIVVMQVGTTLLDMAFGNYALSVTSLPSVLDVVIILYLLFLVG